MGGFGVFVFWGKFGCEEGVLLVLGVLVVFECEVFGLLKGEGGGEGEG